MALWTGLGQVATLAQPFGADVGGLISMIIQASRTARQNKKECQQLARRVHMIAQLLQHVQVQEAAEQLDGLSDTLRDAHELVVSSQGRSSAYKFVMAGRQAERFREVGSQIDSYLSLFPMISHIGMTRNIERIYNALVQDDSARAELSQFQQSSQLQSLFQDSTEVAQEVVPHGTQEFTLAEIMAATNNFSPDNLIGEGGFGMVYYGRLHDGREVAVKRMKNIQSSDLQEEFRTELNILSQLRHEHIVRLLGSCVSVSKDMLTRQRKEPEEHERLERLIVYEYMHNRTLFYHLHADQGLSEMSSVTFSWKMRIYVLLGVSRAMEHLHCHAPPIIHRDTKSANILFDDNWVPHVSDFGSSVACDIASEELGLDDSQVVGTVGYFAPEYIINGRLSPASDVYSLGVVMLEVLTGKNAYSQGDLFGDFPIVPDFLDKRPVPVPTPWQMQALKHVAWTARRCVKLDAKDRLAISDVIANLEMAHELICRDEPVDEPGQVDELPYSPRASSVSSAGYVTSQDAGAKEYEEDCDYPTSEERSFGSTSDVPDADTEEYEEEYNCPTLEDHAFGSTSDVPNAGTEEYEEEYDYPTSEDHTFGYISDLLGGFRYNDMPGGYFVNHVEVDYEEL